MCSNANERRVGERLLAESKSAGSGHLAMPPAPPPPPPLPTTNSNNSNDKPGDPGGGGGGGGELLASVKRAVLETIVSGLATTRGELIAYFQCFLSSNSSSAIDPSKYLKWLAEHKLVVIVDGASYKPTQLGYAVCAAAMAPDEGLLIFDELSRAQQCFVLNTELHIVYQITPMNVSDYWSGAHALDWNLFYSLVQNMSGDLRRVSELVGVRTSFLLKMIKSSGSSVLDAKLLKTHYRFFTALILNDLVNEVPFAHVMARYGCQKGFLQSLQQVEFEFTYILNIFVVSNLNNYDIWMSIYIKYI